MEYLKDINGSISAKDKKYSIGFVAFLMPIIYSVLDALGTFFDAFYLDDIVEAERKSLKNGDIECIDSCSVMKKYGKYKNPHIVLCSNDNIKITTPEDYYIAEALIQQRKNKEVWGI